MEGLNFHFLGTKLTLILLIVCQIDAREDEKRLEALKKEGQRPVTTAEVRGLSEESTRVADMDESMRSRTDGKNSGKDAFSGLSLDLSG